MALYINKDLNTMVFNSEDFEINRNYIPDLFLGLRELDPKKTIDIALDLEKTPMVFILFFEKILKGSDAEINIYFKEDNELLRKTLETYGLQYKNIADFPKDLPSVND